MELYGHEYFNIYKYKCYKLRKNKKNADKLWKILKASSKIPLSRISRFQY